MTGLRARVCPAAIHLGLRTPADGPSVPHLPVLDKLGPRTKSSSIREVLIQKCCGHGWNYQGAGPLWPSAKQISVSLQFSASIHVSPECSQSTTVDILWTVVLRGPWLQKDRGGASIMVGGAPLYAPPLHP